MSMPSGAALAEAMTSAKVLTGKGGVTTNMFGTSDTRATEEARPHGLRTMLRIAGRTMRLRWWPDPSRRRLRASSG